MTSAVWLRISSGLWLVRTRSRLLFKCHGQQGAPPGLQEVHIGVQIRQADGTPINYLRAKNFNVSSGGRSFPVVVTRPSAKSSGPNAIQTHLLLILPSPPTAGGADLLSEAIEQLGPVWREGWRVAVRTSEGGLTPYVASEEELQQAIREFTVASSTDQAAGRHPQRLRGKTRGDDSLEWRIWIIGFAL